jgi:hypothetical protein
MFITSFKFNKFLRRLTYYVTRSESLAMFGTKISFFSKRMFEKNDFLVQFLQREVHGDDHAVPEQGLCHRLFSFRQSSSSSCQFIFCLLAIEMFPVPDLSIGVPCPLTFVKRSLLPRMNFPVKIIRKVGSLYLSCL